MHRYTSVAARPGTRVSLIIVSLLTALALNGSGSNFGGSGSGKFEGPTAVGYGALLSHREANLYYPGSRVLSRGGWEEYAELCRGAALMCTRGDVPAWIDNQLVVEIARATQVSGWYDNQLLEAGWRSAPSGDALHSHVYARRPDEDFQLTTYSVDESQTLLGVQRSVVLYYTRYQLGTCPSVEAGCRSGMLPIPPNDTRPAVAISSERIYYDDIANRAEAHLYFPASSVMGSHGYGEGAGHLFGFDDPWVRSDLISETATKEEVEAWYEQKLARRGYGLIGTDTSGTREYRCGSEIFKLIVPDGDPTRGPYGVTGLMYAVIYEIDTCQGHHPPICLH